MTMNKNASAKDVKKASHKNSPTKNAKAPKGLVKLNAVKAGKDAVSKREVKYIYPKDCTTPEAKKAFRRTARAAGRSFDRKLKDLKKKTDSASKTELKKLETEHSQWAAKTLV